MSEYPDHLDEVEAICAEVDATHVIAVAIGMDPNATDDDLDDELRHDGYLHEMATLALKALLDAGYLNWDTLIEHNESRGVYPS